MKTHQKTQKLV